MVMDQLTLKPVGIKKSLTHDIDFLGCKSVKSIATGLCQHKIQRIFGRTIVPIL